MVIYILQGQEQCFIEDKISEIVSQSDSEVISFDASNPAFSISSLLEACQGNSLFSQGSIVLVDQPYFLIRKTDEKNIAELLDYVKNPLYDTQLLFYTYLNNFNSKLKIYKQIAQNAQVITLNHLDYKNFSSYMRSRLNEEQITLSSDCFLQLNSLCKRDATLFNRNLEILKLYPGRIDDKVISKLCSSSDDNDSFELINAITSKDVSRAVTLERKMLNESDSLFALIGLLANQLRFLYQIAYLQSTGKERKEILELTGVNEYRLNKALESLRRLNMESIMELLSALSDLDLICKTDSSIGNATRFELFILELLKKV